MSDVPRGDGWWQASDGRFYPPELHPSRPPVAQSTDPAAPATDPDTAWFTGASTAPAVGGPAPSASDRRQRRSWTFVIIGAAVLLIVAGIIVAVTSGGRSSGPGTANANAKANANANSTAKGVGAGVGTFRITWNPTPNGAGQSNPQPFTGFIGGQPVRGVAEPPQSQSATGGAGAVTTIPGTFTFATWSGTYAGKTFHLQVTLGTKVLTFDVRGSYGDERVVAVARPNLGTGEFTFSGTVGPSRVTGTVSSPTKTGIIEFAAGTFRVQ